MPRESITVQCYPSDSAVNKKVKQYEAFGWELIGNQKIKESTGSVMGVDGNTYENFSTYVKLTFSREKSSEWYNEVTALERRHDEKMDECKRMRDEYPVADFAENEILDSALARVVAPVLLFFVSACLLFIPFIIYMRVMSKRKKKKIAYHEAERAWHNKYDAAINKLETEAESIRAEATEVILRK